MDEFKNRWVSIRAGGQTRWWIRIKAKLDTGAKRCSIDDDIARALNLPLIGTVTVRNAMGRQIRPLYKAKIRIGNQRHEIELSGANREHLSTPMIIGKEIIERLFT